ncbi:unnamed protein product [Orchesella dallaii]|uniref:C-type lectin domain-containing protein n=1 Tax=Orchesella dallaii TaxID=48710 RepID=A0ABP1QGJ1_9HEXA
MKKITFFFRAFVTCWLVHATIGQFQTVTYGGHTFSVSDNQLPWAEAVNACNANGQSLASVEDMEKDDILVQLFVEKLHTNVTMKGNSWISANEVSEGVWHWASLNKPTYYTRWFVGQPDDIENLNCVYMALNSLLYWRDANCSASMYFVCEGQPTTGSPVSSSLPSSTPGTSGAEIHVLETTLFLSIFMIIINSIHTYL